MQAIRLLDSMLWVFKGTTRSNWLLTSPDAAEVVVVHQSEGQSQIDAWRGQGKLVVLIDAGDDVPPAAVHVLKYPFTTLQVLSLLERLEGELNFSGETEVASAPDAQQEYQEVQPVDEWAFVEALRTLNAVRNADLWLVGVHRGVAVLWLRGDGSRYHSDAATAKAIKDGSLKLSGLTLQKKSAPPEGLGARSGIELAWFASYHAATGFASWIDTNAAYRLARWPDLGLLRVQEPAVRAAQIRIVAALDSGAVPLASLAQRADAAPELTARVINALSSCGCIETVVETAYNTARAKSEAPVEPGMLRQFLTKLRRHLKLHT